MTNPFYTRAFSPIVGQIAKSASLKAEFAAVEAGFEAIYDGGIVGGAALVGYTAAGAGAVDRTVEGKLQESLSVKDFGAVGNGTDDDTAAIQLARAAAAGATLWFPAGTYLLTATTVFNCDCVFEHGAVLHVEAGTATFVRPVHAPIRSKVFTWNTGNITMLANHTPSVMWFGALGNASANDSPAVQKCYTAVSSQPAVPYFPSGSFLLNDKITVTNSRTGLQGESSGSTIIRKGILNDDLFLFYSGVPATTIFHIVVRSVSFDTAAAAVHTAGAMLHIAAANRVSLTGIYIGNPYIGIKLSSVANAHLDDIDSANDGGLAFQGYAHFELTELTGATKRQPTNVFLSNVRARGPDLQYPSDYGLLIRAADGVWVDNCYFGQNDIADIRTWPVNADTQLTGVMVSNTWLDPVGSLGSAFSMMGGSTSAYGYTQLTGCRLAGGNNGLSAIRILTTAGYGLQWLQFVGNTISNFTSHGILIDANGTAGFETAMQVKISSNSIHNCGNTSGSGITIASTKHFSITDNSVGYNLASAGMTDPLTATTADYGIAIAATCDHYIVTGNSVLGNTADISDAGGPSKLVSNNLTTAATTVVTIASASTIDVPETGDVFYVSGTTTIDNLSNTAERPGRRVTLIFLASVTVSEGGNLKLATPFGATADDTLSLVYDGTYWVETSRSVN